MLRAIGVKQDLTRLVETPGRLRMDSMAILGVVHSILLPQGKGRADGLCTVISSAGAAPTSRKSVPSSSLLPHVSSFGLLLSMKCRRLHQYLVTQINFLTFPQANVSAIQKKIFDLNAKMSEEPVRTVLKKIVQSCQIYLPLQTTTSDCSMDSADTMTLQTMVSSLSASPSSFTLDTASTSILEKLLDWPAPLRFPVLDLIRIVSLHASVTFLIFQLLSNLTPNPSSPAKENETNAMLALRGVANAFGKDKSGMSDSAPEILETLAVVGTEGLNKNGKTALATVAVNYSILAAEGLLNTPSVAHLLEIIEKLLPDSDAESFYRTLVAFGNVMCSPEDVKGSLQVGRIQSIMQQAQSMAEGGEQRSKDIIKEIRPRL